jgi:acyl carrier protein
MAAALAPAGSPPIEAGKVLAVVAAVAREARSHGALPEVSLDSSLERDLALDSLARVELVLRLEREFATSLPEQALATSETPRDLLRFLLSSVGQAARAADTTVASLAQSADVRPPLHAQTLAEALEYHVERQPDRLTIHLHEGRARRRSPTAVSGTGRSRTVRGSRTPACSPARRSRSCCRRRRSTCSRSTACCSRAASRCRCIRRRG